MTESLLPLRHCHDCGAAPGEFHKPGCDVERCARCGGQTISCGCIYGIDVEHMEERHPNIYSGGPTDTMYRVWDREWGAKRLPWTGIWPGAVQARLKGLFCRWTNRGWQACNQHDEGARGDLNRLALCEWDPEKGRYR